jgi:hypothetical protein
MQKPGIGMPAIRGVYYEHPQTGEPGVWIWCAWGNNPVIGFNQAQLDNVRVVGTPENRRLLFKQAVEGGLHAVAKRREALVDWTQEELEAKAADPLPYISIDLDTGERVIQPIVVVVTALSLDSPRSLQIEVSDGAYTLDTRYG